MKTFLSEHKPVFTTMLQVRKPQDCFQTIKKAKALGTDAFGFQIEQFERQYRTEEIYRDLFENKMGDYPVYVTSYRAAMNQGMSDEECVDELLFALKCGGTLGDIMGNAFDKSAPDELTLTPIAIDKQKRLIDKMHAMGKEVLMSTHVWRFIPAEKVVEIGLAQESRGVDIAKIVMLTNTAEEEVEGLRALTMLKKEMKIPFLFLCGGSHCQVQRMTAPYFGNALSLCVESYDDLATKIQPPIEKAKKLLQDLYFIK